MLDLFSIIKYWFTLILCPYSFCCNLTLFFLIKYKSPKNMENYKKILFLGCVADLCHSIWYFFFEPDITVINGVFFIFTRAILGYVSSTLSVWTYNVSLFFVYFSFVNPVIQFIYRYLLVCRNIILNKWAFIGLIFLGAAVVASYPMNFVIHLIYRNVTEEAYTYLLNGTEWDMNGKIPSFGALPLWEFPNVFYLVLCITVITYSIIIFCGIAVYLEVKRQASQVSQDVNKYQKQVSIVMTVEATIPVITIVLPIFLDLSIVLFNAHIPWEGKVVPLLTSLSPAINPMVKMMVISPYRKYIFQLINPKRFFPLLNSNASASVQIL